MKTELTSYGLVIPEYILGFHGVYANCQDRFSSRSAKRAADGGSSMSFESEALVFGSSDGIVLISVEDIERVL